MNCGIWYCRHQASIATVFNLSQLIQWRCMSFAFLYVENVVSILCYGMILLGFKLQHLGEMFVCLNFLGKRWMFWGEMTAESQRCCLIWQFLRWGRRSCFKYLLFFHPGKKRSKYKKRAPASFILTLKIDLIKQYLCFTAVISSWNNRLFSRKLIQTNISPKCCYFEPYKSCHFTKWREHSQHPEKQMTCNVVVSAVSSLTQL